MLLSRIQFSTEKHDRSSLNNNNDSHHCQCAADEAMEQENSMFSNRTKRIGSTASDTTLVSVFDLATAVFPAWELQLTWSTAGCFSTPSHLLLSLRKLLRGKPLYCSRMNVNSSVKNLHQKTAKDWWREAYLFQELLSEEDKVKQE